MGYSIIFRDKTRTESVTKATSPGLKQDTYPTTDVSIPTDTELGTQLTSTGKLSVTGRNSLFGEDLGPEPAEEAMAGSGNSCCN